MSILGFDKATPGMVLYAGNKICGYDGIGRHAGFRFLCASVGVQVPIPVPELDIGLCVKTDVQFHFTAALDYTLS